MPNFRNLMSGDSGAALVEVENSALFDKANSEYLGITPAAAGNRKKWTFSTWFYKAEPEVTLSRTLLHGYVSSGNGGTMIVIDTNDKLGCQSDSSFNRITNAIFRDIGWYHIVVGLDAANTTLSIEVNGVAQTLTGTQPSNIDYAINNNTLQAIGRYSGGGSPTNYLEGYLAETVFTDGQLYTATDFGEYDETGLYWTPLASATIKALTFGTNGFYLDNTTNAQTDASGNGNNFTNNNTVVTSTHTPTNLMNLWNPLVSSGTTYTVGNKTGQTNGTVEAQTIFGSLTMPGAGKWYIEVKPDTIAYFMVGLVNASGSGGELPHNQSGAIRGYNQNTEHYVYYNVSGQLFIKGANNTDYGASYSTSDYVGIAADCDNGNLFFSKSGTWQKSATASEIAAGTGTNAATTALNNEYQVTLMNAGGTNKGTIVDEADWQGTPPTGFVALTSANIAAATDRTASDTNKYFQTTLYEGNGGSQRVGAFQPFDNTFTVAKSALFNVANSEYFSRTFESPTDQDVWTLSWWMKTGYMGDAVRGIMASAASNSSIIYVTRLNIYIYFNGAQGFVFDVDDPSQWQNIILTCNSGTLTCYWNGVSRGTASVNMGDFNSAVAHTVGSYNGSGSPFDGYMADFIFVDGTVHSTSVFGQTDTSTNRWIPKDPTITLDEASDFGNNGFYLNFADSSALGDDVSGNNHDFTNNNTVTQSTDSPTTNWNVITNTTFSGGTLSNGNRSLITGSSQYGPALGSLGIDSGKWYWEIKPTAKTLGTLYCLIGISRGINLATGNNLGYQVGDYGYYSLDGDIVTNNNGAGESYGASYALNDIIGVALDLDNKTLTLYKNNSSQGVITGLLDGIYYTAMGDWDNSSTVSFEARFDSSLWSYSAPTDHIALAQDNIASSDQFISAFSWIKNRDATDNHMLFDRVRGATKDWHSNTTDAEVTNVNTVQRFLEAGVQVGNDVQVNTANESYVLWNWMMENTGSGASNEDGTINTTATLVDQTLGMSVSTYTGTGANATIGHGLGVAPTFVIIKRLTGAGYNPTVAVNSGDLNFSKRANLDTTGAFAASSTFFQDTNPSPTVITLGSNSNVNASSVPHVCYAFAPSQFISIGSYSNSSGTVFVPTLNSLGVPIQPVFFLAKTYSAGTSNWIILDNKREGYNVDNDPLYPNTTGTEATTDLADIVTGGIKARANADPFYTTYSSIYMAIGTPIIDVDGRIIAGR